MSEIESHRNLFLERKDMSAVSARNRILAVRLIDACKDEPSNRAIQGEADEATTMWKLKVPHPSDEGYGGYYLIDAKQAPAKNPSWKGQQSYGARARRFVEVPHRLSAWSASVVGEPMLYVPLTKALALFDITVVFPESHLPIAQYERILR